MPQLNPRPKRPARIRSLLTLGLAAFAWACGADEVPPAPPGADAASGDQGPGDQGPGDQGLGDQNAHLQDLGHPDADPRDDAGPPRAIESFQTVVVEGEHAGGTDCLRAECPAGTRILGGGGAWPAGLNLTHLEPVPAEDAWVLCGTLARPGPWSVEAHCGRITTEIRYIETRGRLDGEDCLVADCPDGLTLVGGGGSAGAAATLSTSFPTLIGWRLCGESPITTSIQASAICVEGAQTERSSRAGNHPGGAQQVCLAAPCPPGTRTTGGGGQWRTVNRTANRSADDGASFTLCGAALTPTEWSATALCLADR